MDEIWWNKVTNAAHFLELIVDNIQNGRSVLLQLPKNVPWYTTMQEIVSNEVVRANSTRSYKNIMDVGDDPGEYLFNEFCKSEKRAHYRPGIGYPEFLAGSDDIPLNQYILWIYGADAGQVKRWYKFVDEYNKALGKNKQGCLFIIETFDAVNLQEKKGIRIVSYEKNIEYYDNYLFNMLVASELKESAIFKQYLAEAVTLMIPDDVELSSMCIAKGREFLNFPVLVLNKIVEENFRSDRTDFCVTTTEKHLNDRLWEAQIKVIFPLVEKQRSAIIKKYRKDIESLLPLKAAYGEEFSEASQVEIGTMAYLISCGKINVDKEDARRVTVLKNARNTLAHIGTLTQEEVDEVLKL